MSDMIIVNKESNRVFIQEPNTHENRDGIICLTLEEAKELIEELTKKVQRN